MNIERRHGWIVLGAASLVAIGFYWGSTQDAPDTEHVASDVTPMLMWRFQSKIHEGTFFVICCDWGRDGDRRKIRIPDQLHPIFSRAKALVFDLPCSLSNKDRNSRWPRQMASLLFSVELPGGGPVREALRRAYLDRHTEGAIMHLATWDDLFNSIRNAYDSSRERGLGSKGQFLMALRDASKADPHWYDNPLVDNTTESAERARGEILRRLKLGEEDAGDPIRSTVFGFDGFTTDVATAAGLLAFGSDSNDTYVLVVHPAFLLGEDGVLQSMAGEAMTYERVEMPGAK